MGMNDRQERKRKSKPKETERAFRFINHTLTTEQKNDLRSMDSSIEFPAEMVDALVGEGYKYSLSFDERNQSFVAAITDRDTASAFYNACLTGRGSTADNARVSLLYRHFHLAQGDWSALTTASGHDVSDFE